MKQARLHTFQVLTKRADRLADVADKLPWPNNVWVGVSVESQDCQDYLDRMDIVRSTPAYVKFLAWSHARAASPNFNGIDWAIAGAKVGRPRAQ
ncbi:DUF5131 family protein [Bradyrhizobium genosp. P]|uniref:DUF5131 family protein n=1 Tax=Bradyrhizobium genosp. P TaxID=83641 RepID=UPI003CECEF2B